MNNIATFIPWKKVWVGLFFIVLPFSNKAQESVLDAYIKEGLESNILIQKSHLSLENAIYALRSARHNYIPTLNFEGLFTTAEGGRSYEIPVGDYLNPLLNTVNDFLGPGTVVPLENERINFLPKNYYDAKVRLSVPILNMDIIHNNRIHEKQLTVNKQEIEIFSRELVKEIKTTYYQYLTATKAIEIYDYTIELAQESKRINERLVDVGTGVYAYVLRAETEIEQAKSKRRAAELQAQTIRMYFNALLNRELDAEIIIEESDEIIPIIDKSTISIAGREELMSLEQAIAIREDLVRMNKQIYLPRLNGFVDLGSQAEEMRFDKESLYYMVGLQLTIPIFNGTKNNIAVKRSVNEVEMAKLHKEDVTQKLKVAVNKSYNEVLIHQSNYEASLKQLEMAQTYHRLIDKGYASGVNTYIETVDARTQLSTAKIAVNLNYYQLLEALAKLERETAAYPIPVIQ